MEHTTCTLQENVKTNNYLGAKKLISGLIMLGLSILMHNTVGYNGDIDVDKWSQGYLVPLIGKDSGLFFSATLGAICAISIAVFFIKGLFRIITFNQFIECIEGKNTSGCELSAAQQAQFSKSGTSNIDEAYAYRNFKAGYMTPDKAAEFYMETSRLNNSMADSDTIGYVNSKMGMMSPDQKIDFLQGKK